MDAQMKKGVLEMCLLYLISQEELYGYVILQKMHVYFPEVENSTFYAILRRLNKEGLTETYEGIDSNGPTRKYIRITTKGQESFNQAVLEWKKLVEIIQMIGIMK